MNLFQSIKKTSKLRKISKKLGKSLDFSNLLESIMDKSKDDAEEELLELCVSDSTLKSILDTHHVSKEELREIYHQLLYDGAGQWVRGHYVAASALAYQQTLEYLLQSKKQDIQSSGNRMQITVRLIQYFAKGETGAIND